jgi:Domain of unknown function (DUF4878)
MNTTRSLKFAALSMAALLLLWACGSGGSAQAVSEKFLHAMASGDLATAKQYASKDAQTALDMLAGNVAAKKNNPAVIEQIVAQENGDKAYVTYVEDGIAQHMDMVKEGGAWKVAWTKGDGGASEPDQGSKQLEAAMDAAMEMPVADTAKTE